MTTGVVPNSDGLAAVHQYSSAEIQQAGLAARAQPKRRYGIPARILFLALDLIYGKKSTTEKFRVLEVVARVPYQAWEQVAS